MIVQATGWALVMLVCPTSGNVADCGEQLVTGYVYHEKRGCDDERRRMSISGARCEELVGIIPPEQPDGMAGVVQSLNDYAVGSK